MSSGASGFYVAGGTLRRDAPCCVERQADRDLYEGLQRGEFCYVLTSRQMGKSSLMIRTAARLRTEGIRVAILDLAAFGQNLSLEQWYAGLLSRVGREWDLEDELEEYWIEHERWSPLQRWMDALRQVLRSADPNLVIFVDEIDVVQSLPFSTDEFFAAIRECYNRRTEEPELERLTFCLLGVAAPSDLIQDVRTTPFNIGRRIELRDFAAIEAVPLAQGLSGGMPRDKSLLQRVLYWTGGHPYLTQRLCQAIADDPRVTDFARVDRVCEDLFLSHRARERDNNLLFVSDRLLRSATDISPLLTLYARVRSSGQKVPDDETNPLVSLLRQSGIVREQKGYLQVRNRIYARVFDRAWVETNLPDAELRRLRALARDEARKRRYAEGQRRLAEEREQALRRSLYVSDLNLAQQSWVMGNVARALELLEAHRPDSGQEDLRSFEWRYLWRCCQQGDALLTLGGHDSAVRSVAFSPDGGTLAAGSEDGAVQIWDMASGEVVASFEAHAASVCFTAFSPDGGRLLTGSDDGTIRLWDTAVSEGPSAQGGAFHGFRLLQTVLQVQDRSKLALSPDGTILAVCGADGTVKLQDLTLEQPIGSLKGHEHMVIAAAFAHDGRTLATGSYDATVRLWDVAGKRELTAYTGYTGGIFSVAFSPDGRYLVSSSWDGIARLWDLATGELVTSLRGHKGGIAAVVFSSNGQFLASVGDTVRLWDVTVRERPREVRVLKGHTGWVSAVAFTSDARFLATGSGDGTVKLWPTSDEQREGILRGHSDQVWCLAFSPDGKILATGSYDHTVRLWDVVTEREIGLLEGHDEPVSCLAFSPDGRTLESGKGAWNAVERPGDVRLWDVSAQRQLAALPLQETAVQSLAFSPEGQILAIRSSDGTVELWNMAESEHLGQAQLSPPRERLSCREDDLAELPGTSTVVFSADGTTMATGGLCDRAVQLWDVQDCRKKLSLPVPTDGISTASFSLNGRTLAIGGHNGVIALWDVSSERMAVHLKEVAGVVYSVTFTPDGMTLAAGYLDSTVRLWDTRTNRQVATLHGHENVVTSVAFSPDGNILASGSSDHTVRLWRAAPLSETDSLPGNPRQPSR